MNELIKVSLTTFGNDEVNSINARDLHVFLESKQDFSDWIKNRIEQYDFIEDSDFTIFLRGSTGGRPAKEYHITIDMAKELSMVERNEKGKQARQYFIECERRLRAPVAMTLEEQLVKSAQALLALRQDITQIAISQRTLEDKVDAFTAGMEYYSIVAFCNINKVKVDLKEAAKMGSKASRICRDNGYIVGKITDPRFGMVNTYAVSVLEEIIKVGPHDGKPCLGPGCPYCDEDEAM